MDVDKAKEGLWLVGLIKDAFAKLLDRINCWMKLRARGEELAIEVIAG